MPHFCHIRAMTEDDIPRLVEIRPGFVSDTVLAVEKTGSGIETGWRLVERRLARPFDKGHAYDFDREEQANIRARLRRGDGLHLVAERDGRLVDPRHHAERERDGLHLEHHARR